MTQGGTEDVRVQDLNTRTPPWGSTESIPRTVQRGSEEPCHHRDPNPVTMREDPEKS